MYNMYIAYEDFDVKDFRGDLTRIQHNAIEITMLLFVWNTLTVLLTVSTTIPLHQYPHGVDVVGIQGMQ